MSLSGEESGWVDEGGVVAVLGISGTRAQSSCCAVISIRLLAPRLVTLSSKAAAGVPAMESTCQVTGGSSHFRSFAEMPQTLLHHTGQNSATWPHRQESLGDVVFIPGGTVPG